MADQTQATDLALPATGYVREKELIGGSATRGRPAIRGLIPFSHATLWRKVKAEEFPAPVKLSAGVTAWRVEDVRAWMASRQ